MHKTILISILAALLLVSNAHANYDPQTSCSIRVDLLKGSNSSSRGSSNSSKIVNDLKPQLSAMPFKHFSLLKSEMEMARFEETARFSLRDAESGIHQIEVSPLVSAAKKIQALVSWKGSNNAKLLNTKLWLRNGRNMVVGAETAGNTSLVVNISILCAP